jgi:hypothetical protein
LLEGCRYAVALNYFALRQIAPRLHNAQALRERGLEQTAAEEGVETRIAVPRSACMPGPDKA